MRRKGSTGRSMPTIFAIEDAHAPAQFTTVRAETVSRVVATSKPLFLRAIPVALVFFHNVAPWSLAQVMNPTIALFGSTNPSVEQKLPPTMSSLRKSGNWLRISSPATRRTFFNPMATCFS